MPPRRASPNRPVRTTPAQGGRLITRTSSEVPGFENYTWKHDFRRDLTDEIRREGDDYFRPNLSIPIGNQPFPQNQGFVLTGFQNGGFELDNDSDGIPDDWDVTVSAGITQSLDAAVFASDGSTQSVKFLSTLAGAEGFIENETVMPVTEGRMWRLAWKMKADTAGIRVDVRVVWYDEDDAVINDPNGNTEWTIYSSTDNPTADFTPFSYHITPPVQAVSGRLRFYGKVSSTVATGSVWFDSLTLDEAESSILPINLVHYVRRPNGKACLIVGTKTTLYRYFAFDNGDYFVDDLDPNYFVTTGLGTPFFVETGPDTPVFVESLQQGEFVDSGPGTPVFAENPGEWQIIGTGFSPNGHRWEALNINGFAVFNNGYDLPVTYQEQDPEVLPIYELREAGVALAGTIWENSGILMLGDIAQMKEATIADNFAHESSGTTTAKQYGSVNSSPLLATTGAGYAVSLDGTNDYIAVPDSASLDLLGTLTLEVAVKLDTVKAHGFISKGLSFPTGPIWYLRANLDIPSQTMKLAAKIGSDIIESVSLLDVDSWVQLAVTYDGSFLKLFINGILDSTVAVTSFIVATTGAVAIGAVNNGGPLTNFCDGTIAEARVWNVARTPNQIFDNQTVDVTGQTGLAAYWKFDEGAGVSAADSTGNGNTGTLTNGAAFVPSTAPNDAFVVTESIAESTLARVTNVSTFTSTAVHHLSTGDLVTITGAADASFNVTDVAVTKLDDFRFTYPNAGANATTTTAVARRSFFTAGMAGKFLSFSNGLTTRINSVSNGTTAKVNDSVASLVGYNLPFHLYSTSTAQLTGTVTRVSGAATLVGAGTLFTTELSVGQLIRVPNGSGEEVRKITVITDNTNLTVESNWSASGAATAIFRVSDFTVLSSAAIFEASDVGRQLYWPDGSTRTITAFQNASRVDVNSHLIINPSVFELENLTAYSAITNASFYDRIQYRVMWGVPDEPRTFASTVGATIAAGSNIALLSYPVRSLESGMQVTILGAGTLGADFTATIVLVAADGQRLILDQSAVTGVTDSLLQRTSSIGSIAGFNDLQDDNSSAVIAGKDLRGRTVIYKDTAIHLCDYIGDPAQPFAFSRPIQTNQSLHFKYTLINPEGTYHLYAGENGFFMFDLTTQAPVRVELFDYIDNQFYPTAKIVDNDEIFAGLCGPTNEVFFMFPDGVEINGIAYDFKYKTISTLGVEYTAVNTVSKPVPGIPIGVQEDWCVCGDGNGTVILYGRGNGPQEQWGGALAMFNRRGSGYTSKLRSGLFGGGWKEMDLTGYLPEISSQSRPNITGLTVNMYGFRNPAEMGTLLFSRAVAMPDKQNLIPCFFRRNYLQDEIVISGVNNPIRIAARSVEVGGVNSDSPSRRPI